MAARAVLDEFTAPAEKAALLERSRGRIEGLFGVSLAVLGALGAEEPLPARIWLQLLGAQEAVHSAKVSAAAAPARSPSQARPQRARAQLSVGRGPWAPPHTLSFLPFMRGLRDARWWECNLPSLGSRAM